MLGLAVLGYMSFGSLWHGALFAFLYGMLYVSMEAGLEHIVAILSPKPPS